MKYPSVTIIIVNYNGWQDTIECLESVYQINYPNFSVAVIDNNSSDESQSKIITYCKGELDVHSPYFEYNSKNKPLGIHLLTGNEEKININDHFNTNSNTLFFIENKENKGFAEGNNIGIKFAQKNLQPKYILLLNNDTVVDKNFLKTLVEKGESEKYLGILGPKIYSYNNPELIWSAGCKISWKLSRGIQIGTNELDHGQFDDEREVEYVSGSAYLIKTEVIQKIGLMDKKYFLYFEESDWTLRANQVGYKSIYVPKAKIWHKISKSGGGMSKPIGLYYITRNRWIFMKKWAKRRDYAIFIISQIVGFLLLPIFLSIYYHNRKLLSAYYHGFFDGIKSS